MADLGFCIHGHFYQPPREDPLSGAVPEEAGAAPYSNWNERIHDQCYKPNAELGNYERISFNFGPTLLDWMADADPHTLELIAAQDRANLARYGVGNAMAQSYNHTILPLATREDKFTQVRWGIADFEHRFGHHPLGMWLPETGADLETLEVLAECGIQFTILAPWQADLPALDGNQPYWVGLPGGKRIAVFFYNQELSTRVSFDPGATTNADRFVWEAIMPQFRARTGTLNRPRMVMIASDGELYGHHQPFRDRFLSYLLDGALKNTSLKLTFPALWLKQHPPEETLQIIDNTSWSCHHGVTRWMGTCGCTPGADWKAPLRRTLNQLAQEIDECFKEVMAIYGLDAQAMRDAYIQVVLGQVSFGEWLAGQAGRRMPPGDEERIELLLRAQYERQRIFTSCGWFFDDFDRIEPRNNVAYAAQAVWLTQKATGYNLAPAAIHGLRAVRSARTGLRGDVVFEWHLSRAKAMRVAV